MELQNATMTLGLYIIGNISEEVLFPHFAKWLALPWFHSESFSSMQVCQDFAEFWCTEKRKKSEKEKLANSRACLAKFFNQN